LGKPHYIVIKAKTGRDGNGISAGEMSALRERQCKKREHPEMGIGGFFAVMKVARVRPL
jgi:hypothetical protein